MSAFMPSYAQEVVKVGDYVEFGTYLNEPILWRVISKDKSGNPLLYSEHILCAKAFDAAGNKYSNVNRAAKGSNNWETSTLRTWLNSEEEVIAWPNNIPSMENLFSTQSFSPFFAPYNNEKGFLANGNFSIVERQMIKTVTHKTVLPKADISSKDGGKDVVEDYRDYNIGTLGYLPFFKYSTDKVFLLSQEEFIDYKYQVVKKEYEIESANPTMSAVNDPSLVTSIGYYGTCFAYPYWLRTPLMVSSFQVLEAGTCNGLRSGASYSWAFNTRGVRPALYLDSSVISVVKGEGSDAFPYVFQSKFSSNGLNQVKNSRDVKLVLHINQMAISSDQVLLKDNSVYITLRSFLTSIGGQIGVWDPSKQEGVILYNGQKIPYCLYIHSETSQVFYGDTLKSSITRELGRELVLISGRKHWLYNKYIPTITRNNQTFVLLRSAKLEFEQMFEQHGDTVKIEYQYIYLY